MVPVKIFDVKSPAQTVARLKMKITIKITTNPLKAPLISEGLRVSELPMANVR